MSAAFCCRCGRAVSEDEIAVTKKLINRGAVSFFCVPCLAAYFDITPDLIEERIVYFKATGCTLFSAQQSSQDSDLPPRDG